jgi:hypothetical protein
MCGMVCTCTFQAYRLGERLQDYLALSNETMIQSGIGFRNTILKGYSQEGIRYRSSSLMRR